MQAIKSLLKARREKAEQMNQNFEPTARIQSYKDQSRDTIIQTYRDILAKTKIEIGKDQEKIKEKYRKTPMDQDRLNRELIKAAALESKALKTFANGLLGDIPLDPMHAYIVSKELRSRGENDLADRLSFHAQNYLEQPWVKDESYNSLKGVNERIDIYTVNSTSFMCFDLSTSPRKGSVVNVDDFDTWSEQ